ncbi:MAG: DUF1552 domain-containing protein [Acidobacteria bacterium]|nr:DUF1552 domain-containing protein [Acidobacteriota bacterium]
MPVRGQVSRRAFLKGLGLGGAIVRVGLPALAWAKESVAESRFLLWFNGNGIPERYWIPAQTGPGYELTPCLAPLGPFRNDIHVITGLDNPAARLPGPGNDHHRSMSALVSGTSYTGRGCGGPSIDQVIAAKLGGDSRFRSLQVGVCQESHGESIQRNLSWAAYDRALPPEVIPHNLFDRLFGSKDQGWVNRKHSILDAVRDSAADLKSNLGAEDRRRLDEHLTSVREMERAVASLPPHYGKAQEPEPGGDMADYPRIAKLQTDLLVHALASHQTRVASYMLTKCQSLVRFPWLGYTALRHHDYTHTRADGPEGQRILRDICRWHVEEFAYLLARLKSVPEGDGTLLDHCCVLFLHEHAEANAHKNNGLAAIVAGHAGGLKTGLHSEMTGTMADLYLTVAGEVMKTRVDTFPTADRKLAGIV